MPSACFESKNTHFVFTPHSHPSCVIRTELFNRCSDLYAVRSLGIDGRWTESYTVARNEGCNLVQSNEGFNSVLNLHSVTPRAGNIKMTQSTAFTVAMLAWGVTTFPKAYASAKATTAALIQLEVGIRFLQKTMVGYSAGSTNYSLVYQARRCERGCIEGAGCVFTRASK